MKITQIHTNKPQSLSFEIFPPKKEEDFKNIDEMLEILCDCHPEYISVTFGAGGSSNNNKTIEIAKKIKNQYNVEPVVHLTCLCHLIILRCNLLWQDMLYTMILDTHIDDIRCVRRQSQITVSLSNEKNKY